MKKSVRVTLLTMLFFMSTFMLIHEGKSQPPPAGIYQHSCTLSSGTGRILWNAGSDGVWGTTAGYAVQTYDAELGAWVTIDSGYGGDPVDPNWCIVA